MTDEKLDLILKQALSPEIDDCDVKIKTMDMERKENMINYEKNKNFKKSSVKSWKHAAVAAAAIAVTMVSSITAYAAWRYFSAKDVAAEIADNRLAQEFEQNNWMDECETQTYGNYDITLLGIVSGDEISSHLSKTDSGEIDGDKTYMAVAIAHSGGTPMPDSSKTDEEQFYVSPYIEGLDPARYNASVLGGNNTLFVSDGIQYRLLETDNIECFADRKIYMGVSEGEAYDDKAYVYDSVSGAISRNESYEGVNALFTLSIDSNLADQKRAAEVIAAMDNYEAGGEYTEILSEADRWVNSITPENIDEKATPLESSRQVLSLSEFAEYVMGEAADGADVDAEAAVLDEYFPDGVGMSEVMTKSAASKEDAYVETYTLNSDDTVTILRYVPA